MVPRPRDAEVPESCCKFCHGAIHRRPIQSRGRRRPPELVDARSGPRHSERGLEAEGRAHHSLVEHTDTYSTDEPERRCPDIIKACLQSAHDQRTGIEEALRSFFGRARTANGGPREVAGPSAEPIWDRTPMRRTYVASVGDAESPLTWSGIPYHLTEAGKDQGFITGGLRLRAAGRRTGTRRAAWNLAQVLRGDRKGGYQYSVGFLERLWGPARAQLSGARTINCFQLYPPSVVADPLVERWFFIDLTLEQVFDYYLLRPAVGRRVAADALAREREGYARARGIAVMSRFAAASVRDEYGVPAERIHVVVPGANLDPAAYARWEAEQARGDAARCARGDVLRLVMVTTEWRRKGLDRLLRSMRLARRDGARIVLKVIGARREDLPPSLVDQEGIEWLGRIRKDTDAPRFLRVVADADVGCIFSRYEAGGSVLREYHALGLAALATTAGGMPDFMFDDANITVGPDAPDEELAAALLALAKDPARVQALKAAAWRRRHEALWPAAVRGLRAMIERSP
jgi:glycosyltransferase involved in cell wall biosynthesis